MREKPIKVNWEELEVAFNNRNEELVYYLDLITGHVVLDDEDDLDDEERYYDRRGTSTAPKDDDTRAYIAPPQTQLKLEWMRAFLAENEATDAEAVSKLREAMVAADPAAAISATLREQDEIRDRWYLYRAECLHGLIQSWLNERGVRVSTQPPW